MGVSWTRRNEGGDDGGPRVESAVHRGEHRRLHQEASDFVRWGRRGGRRTLALYGRPYFSLLARFRWGRIELEALTRHRAGSSKGGGSQRPAPACIIMVSAYTIREGGGW